MAWYPEAGGQYLADRPCTYKLLPFCVRLSDVQALGDDVSGLVWWCRLGSKKMSGQACMSGVEKRKDTPPKQLDRAGLEARGSAAIGM